MDVKVIASGSSGNCYRVSDGSTALLLDAGIPIKQIRQGCDFSLAGIDACFITHYHSDHSMAAYDLVRAGIHVFMTRGEIEMLGQTARGKKSEGCVIRELPKDPDADTYPMRREGTFMVRPFKTEHDTPEPVGFFIQSLVSGERLLYFTDTFYLHQRFAPFDYLIGEVNYDEETLWEHVNSKETNSARAKRLFSSHMSLSNFLDFLRANDLHRLKKIWICHMSDDHGNEEKIKLAVQRETGVEVEVC